jgi:hypothetical protein
VPGKRAVHEYPVLDAISRHRDFQRRDDGRIKYGALS